MLSSTRICTCTGKCNLSTALFPARRWMRRSNVFTFGQEYTTVLEHTSLIRDVHHCVGFSKQTSFFLSLCLLKFPRKLCSVNGNKNPVCLQPELFSLNVDALTALFSSLMKCTPFSSGALAADPIKTQHKISIRITKEKRVTWPSWSPTGHFGQTRWTVFPTTIIKTLNDGICLRRMMLRTFISQNQCQRALQLFWQYIEAQHFLAIFFIE